MNKVNKIIGNKLFTFKINARINIAYINKRYIIVNIESYF